MKQFKLQGHMPKSVRTRISVACWNDKGKEKQVTIWPARETSACSSYKGCD